MLTQQPSLSAEQEELLSLLRTSNLSIKNLDERKRDELRMFLDQLHNSMGFSLNDIAKLLGNKTSGYTSWVCRQLGVSARPFEEARLKAIREKRRKYERRPFDGTDEDRAYLLGLRHGDLSVSRPWNGVVRVSTSTTHPAMAELFHSLFDDYGHVYEYPRYKKDTGTYEWNYQANLDASFEFLFWSPPFVGGWIRPLPKLTLSYLAGLLDAEGSIGIYPAKGLISLNVIYYNTDLRLLRLVFKSLRALGFNPLHPYLDKKEGFRSPGFKIEMKKDYWRVALCRFKESQKLLEMLPIRHPEKLAKKALAVSLVQGRAWEETGPRVTRIRGAIKSARDELVEQARKAVEARLSSLGASSTSETSSNIQPRDRSEFRSG